MILDVVGVRMSPTLRLCLQCGVKQERLPADHYHHSPPLYIALLCGDRAGTEL